MTIKRFSKDEWFAMNQADRDYHALEFQKETEKNRMRTVIVTRVIAFLCVGALIFMGFVQLQATKNYDATLDKYGTLGHCYLCGMQNFREASCYYPNQQEQNQIREGLFNYTAKGLEIAEKNVQQCELKWDVAFGGLEIPVFESNVSLNLTN